MTVDLILLFIDYLEQPDLFRTGFSELAMEVRSNVRFITNR